MMKIVPKKSIFGILPSTFRSFASKTRKYPINPQDIDNLPIFDYPTSKSTYSRVFVWGSVSTGALGVPYKTKERDEIEYIRHPKRLKLAERHEVTTVGCGYGFTVYGINSPCSTKLYGTGLNTDSQLGYHEMHAEKPLGILFFPQPIYLPLTNPATTQIKKISAGRAHLMVLTDEGLFILGNNAYGQCGRSIISDENYSGSKYLHRINNIDNKSIVDVECGQDHSLAVTEDGSVYSCGWGADGQTGLGHYECEAQFTKLQGDISSERIMKTSSRADFVLALSDKGDVFGWGNTEYAQITRKDNAQQVPTPTFINMCKPLGRIKDIATGGSFCVVLNEEGHVFVWGYGILGTGPAVQSSRTPLKIPSTLFGKNDFQPDTYVERVASGISHICAITNYGDLYAWGRNKGGCLGFGHEMDQYFPLRVAVGGLVKQVVCGVDHTIALCKPFI